MALQRGMCHTTKKQQHYTMLLPTSYYKSRYFLLLFVLELLLFTQRDASMGHYAPPITLNIISREEQQHQHQTG